MNRFAGFIFGLLQLITLVRSLDNATLSQSSDLPIPQGSRRVIVTHRKGALKSGFSILSRNPRIKQVMMMENLDLSVVIGSQADIQDLENSPDVERVEEDVKYYSLAESIPWGISRTKSNFVWNKGQDGSNVKVCVIDSGVRLSHEDFDQSKISGKAGTDWYTDECSHGAHVAGTIAAKKNNGKGVAGVAPGANLHIIKVFHGSSCDWVYASGLIGAMMDCADAGSNIISMSLGGASYSQSLSDVISDLWNDDILLIAAAGNDGISGGYLYPASYPNVISVAATSSSSNNQLASFSQVNDRVDIAAPGVSVLSIGSGTDIQYTYKSGTSMATPHVSGVAALLWSAYPQANNLQIKDAIEKTAIDLGAPGRDPYYGNGLIDANSAYNYLAQLFAKPIEIVKISMQNNPMRPGRFRISWEFSEPAESRICFYDQKSKNYSNCTKSKRSTLHVRLRSGKPNVSYSFIIEAIDGSIKLADFGPFQHTS